MSNKKKARVKAMIPTIVTNSWKSINEEFIEPSSTVLSIRIVMSSLKYDLIPLAMYSLLNSLILGSSLTNR